MGLQGVIKRYASSTPRRQLVLDSKTLTKPKTQDAKVTTHSTSQKPLTTKSITSPNKINKVSASAPPPKSHHIKDSQTGTIINYALNYSFYCFYLIISMILLCVVYFLLFVFNVFNCIIDLK